MLLDQKHLRLNALCGCCIHACACVNLNTRSFLVATAKICIKASANQNFNTTVIYQFPEVW